MNILRRRSMSINQGGVNPSNPYPFSVEDWVSTADRSSASLTNWNHFRYEALQSDTRYGLMYNLFTGQYTSNAKPGIGQTYFVVPSGASVTVKLKNISNAYAMPIEFYTTVGGADTKISSLQFSRFTNATDKTVTATFTTDQTIGGMWLYIVRTGRNAGNVFECDLEVYVDGDRWI